SRRSRAVPLRPARARDSAAASREHTVRRRVFQQGNSDCRGRASRVWLPFMTFQSTSTLGTSRRALACAALAFALACQSNEKKPETQVAPLASAAAPAAQPASGSVPAAVVPKTVDPGAVELALGPAASKLEIVAAKITRSHDGSFK